MNTHVLRIHDRDRVYPSREAAVAEARALLARCARGTWATVSDPTGEVVWSGRANGRVAA